MRAGADIAFLGGLVSYAIENNRIAKDYLVNFTNAAFIVKDGFKLPEDGLYSGFDAASQTYDRSSWNYEGAASGSSGSSSHLGEVPVPMAGGGKAPPSALPPLPANVASDITLENPRCVFQLLKKQYSRYTPEMVERITGIPKAQF